MNKRGDGHRAGPVEHAPGPIMEGEMTLLPCPNPWCEWQERQDCEPGADYRPQITYSNFGLCYVACTSCSMAGPTRQHEIDATAAWNTRATTSHEATRIAKLEEALERARDAEKRAIGRIVSVARAIGWQAGVGGRETAGAIVSYLATSPDEIAPFMAGDLAPLDFAGDWMRGGCLTWHAANGKVVSPDEVAALTEDTSHVG